MSKLVYYRPRDFYRCRNCQTVWHGPSLIQDIKISIMTWTCANPACGGICDPIPPIEIVETMNRLAPVDTMTEQEFKDRMTALNIFNGPDAPKAQADLRKGQ